MNGFAFPVIFVMILVFNITKMIKTIYVKSQIKLKAEIKYKSFFKQSLNEKLKKMVQRQQGISSESESESEESEYSCDLDID